jgi:hypothetical protein
MHSFERPSERARWSLVWPLCVTVLFAAVLPGRAITLSVQPAGRIGFDVLADGLLVAPIRLAVNGAILADSVVVTNGGIRLSGLHAADPLAVSFGADDYVAIRLPASIANATNSPPILDPVVEFKLSVNSFNPTRWKALFPDGPMPFHFLTCSMPAAQVWHQRGWLNATPKADPFPLLQDVHVGSPEISCLWNRNWSYLCPLGGHPIPVIGLWDPPSRLYVGYDFQGARAADQSERFIATAYCWQAGDTKSFITLAFPYGGVRYGDLIYPQGGETLASWFHLIIDNNLPDTEDPNERFQGRLFDRYGDRLPAVPAMNDLAWIPGKVRSSDFAGPIGLDLWGAGGETTFYPASTILLQGWTGHREMPIDTAVRRGDLASVAYARSRLGTLLTDYAKTFTVAGDRCLYWEKPLVGAWNTNWGGAPVTTMHNSEGWYAARVLVELYRYDRNSGKTNANYLQAIDGLFNWAKHFVWTRNEFPDVPSSPFAIGGTLSSAFLLDYYFTFKDDPQRQATAQQALQLANHLTWRYLQIWAMDSDRFDGALDSAFLLEPNSGRDWAGLACANEVAWNIDSLTQVYVHTGDPRMRYYLRGILQRWPALYRPNYEDSIADYGSDAFTEGLGLFDGSGPGRGSRYSYGFTEPLPLNEPVGQSSLRIVAGAKACIAFDKNGTGSDVTEYQTTGSGACSFRIVSALPGPFDVSFSYPFVDVSKMAVNLVRGNVVRLLGASDMTRPMQSPSSLYLRQLRNGDVIRIGALPAGLPTIPLDAPLTYSETNNLPRTLGSFAVLPLSGDYLLPQDWNDLHSFAGLIPGERWAYGVPYRQRLTAVTKPSQASAPGAKVVLVAYARSEDEALTQSPGLVLDDGSSLPLSGKPAPVWQAWPPIFTRVVLMDFAMMPASRALQQIDPKGTSLMGATMFQGTPAEWQPIQAALGSAGADFAQAESQRLALAALRTAYAQLPAGKIAVLPESTAGAGANFGAATGLRKQWRQLTEQQLVDQQSFNASRYPICFYLGGEHYVKTVAGSGDGKAAITRFLSGGGTLVVLASEPFPFYYGDGPADQPGPPDPLLPLLGLPIQIVFEQPPANVTVQQYPGQNVLASVPQEFAFPPGDQRLRSINRQLVSSAHRYVPLLKVVDAQGRDYGDAAGYVEFRTGPAKGGKVLYVWSTLLSGPQGQAIMADSVSWILNGALRPPHFNSIQKPIGTSVLLGFEAFPSVEYTLEFRDLLGQGGWSQLASIASESTNRDVQFGAESSPSSRFFRLVARP